MVGTQDLHSISVLILALVPPITAVRPELQTDQQMAWLVTGTNKSKCSEVGSF